jgi:hypothetical protein
MKRSLALMGIGAGLMYLFDPEMGEVRRGMLKDRLQEMLPQTGEVLHEKVDAVASKAADLTQHADAIAADKINSAADKISSMAEEHLGTGEQSSGGTSSNGDTSQA